MVEQSREPFLLPLFCYLPHTVQPLGHALPALCRVHAGWNDVLLGLRPSLPNLRRRLPFFVRLVQRYYYAVRLLLNVHVRRSVLAFSDRSAGSAIWSPDGISLVFTAQDKTRVQRLYRADAS